VELARAAGVPREAIVVDPCIGFGKDLEQSAALVESADFLARATGCPVMIGASRKRFLGEISKLEAGQRTLPSVVAAVLAARSGAGLVRVHDVEETLAALRVADAVGVAASRAMQRHAAVTGAGGPHVPDGG
jgi:dihydropteroate synthase